MDLSGTGVKAAAKQDKKVDKRVQGGIWYLKHTLCIHHICTVHTHETPTLWSQQGNFQGW